MQNLDELTYNINGLALRDQITAADRARLQTYVRHLEFPWGLIVNFGKRNLELRWVSRPRAL